MTEIIITVSCDDPSDADWLRTRVHGAVEGVVDDAKAEERLDGNVEVSWELGD